MGAGKTCKNHPMAPAIAECLDCGITLCGMCSRFGEDGVRCERCADTFETRKQVAAQAEKLNRPTILPEGEELPSQEAVLPLNTSKVLQWIRGIALAGVFGGVGVPLYFYAHPDTVLPPSPTRDREVAASRFMECLQVFRQLGEMMEAGENPDMGLQCASPAGPNILRRDGNYWRVSHPNPQLLGIRGLYVTSENPEPVVVQ